MEREWTDPRDGVTWEIEAIPRMQEMRPGDQVPMASKSHASPHRDLRRGVTD